MTTLIALTRNTLCNKSAHMRTQSVTKNELYIQHLQLQILEALRKSKDATVRGILADAIMHSDEDSEDVSVQSGITKSTNGQSTGKRKPGPKPKHSVQASAE